jgi:hypothetical protein
MEDLAPTRVFVLRILPAAASDASQRLILEDTRTGERRAFDTFAALLRYFEEPTTDDRRPTMAGNRPAATITQFQQSQRDSRQGNAHDEKSVALEEAPPPARLD